MDKASRRIDVTRQTWSAWEKGIQIPSHDSLKAIVEAFECPPELVGYEPPRGWTLVPEAWIQREFAELNETLARVLKAAELARKR